MSDEGYIAVKQNEDHNYGTVAMSEEEQGPSATEEAASITQVGSNELVLARTCTIFTCCGQTCTVLRVVGVR